MAGMDPYAQMMQNRANNYYNSLAQNIQPTNQYNGGMTGYMTPQPAPPPAIYGKIVTSENDVSPNDVPLDGKIAAFPQQDLSCVYLKSWNSRGGIDSVKYVPEVTAQPAPEETAYDIRGELEDIKATLARLEQNMNQRKQFNENKKNRYYQRNDMPDESKEQKEVVE